MVVRVPDSFGDLISKGNIKIPCQCYFNARDNILTEILQYSSNELHNSKNTIDFETHTKYEFENLINKNALEKKNEETETLPEYCCVCEYYRNLEKYKKKKDLWNMQFKRWWGWNWPRKRKDFLSKFKSKCEKDCTYPTTSKYEASNLHKKNCNCHASRRNEQEEIFSNNCKPKSIISQQIPESPPNIPEFAESIHPIPLITTSGLRKPYTGRRKRSKHKQRLYEGWVREITSSESDNSIKSVKIRMTSPKMTSNNKNYMRYLSIRLRKLNSEESLDDDKNHNEKCSTIESETKLEGKMNACLVDSKYISPISGKYYNLDLPEISNPFSVINDTEYLKPLDIKDEEIISKTENNWIKHYNMMKEEHSDLLKSICEVLCTSKMNKVESEKEIRNLNYSNLKTSDTNCTLKDKSYKNYEQDNILEYVIKKAKQENDLSNPLLNCQCRSENIIPPRITSTNPFYEPALVRSLTNYNNYCPKPINLPIYKSVQPLLISESSNLFYKDTVEDNFIEPQQNTNENYCKNEEQVAENIEDSNSKKLNYDINYISNNLASFSSTISDTEFIIYPKEISNVNITEDMSERILQKIDLFK